MGGFGIVLDYSPTSLAALDSFIEVLHGKDGDAPNQESYVPSQGKGVLIIQFGCYLGEVVRRAFGGKWLPDPQQPENPLWMHLQIQAGTEIFPLARVFNRFKNGALDSLWECFLPLMEQLLPDARAPVGSDFLSQARVFLAKSQEQSDPARLALAVKFSELAVWLDPSLNGPWFTELTEKLAEARQSDPDFFEERETFQFEEAAQRIVSLAGRAEFGLDFSMASLGWIDVWVSEAGETPQGIVHTKHPIKLDDERLSLGCYVGEVLRRNLGGKWKADGEDGEVKGQVVLINGTRIDPFDWVSERFASGPSRSLHARLKELRVVTPDDDSVASGIFCAEAVRLLEKAEFDARALKFLELALSMDPNNLTALCRKGFLLLPRRRFEESLACFESALAVRLDAELWDGKAAVLAGLGRIDEALAACGEALKRDGRRSSAYGRRGDLLRRAGKIDAALAEYDRAIMFDRKCAPAYFARGEILLERGQYEEALMNFDQVRNCYKELRWHRMGWCIDRKAHLSSSGNTPRGCNALYLVSYFLGVCRENLEHWTLAVTAFQNFLKSPPPGYEAEAQDAQKRLPALKLFDAAWKLANAENRMEFIEAMEKALALDPSRLDCKRQIGIAYSMMDRHEEAIRVFDEILAVNPRHHVTLGNKGTALSKLGRLDEAIVEYEKALALAPDDRSSWRNKVVCIEQLNQPGRMIRFFDETLAANPKHETAWYGKATQELKAGHSAEAARCYREFLSNAGPATPQHLVENAHRALWRIEHPDDPMNPEAAAPFLAQANLAAMNLAFPQAVMLFEQALEIDPVNAVAWQNKSSALMFLGHSKQAMAAAIRACELDSRSESAWKNCAEILMRMNKYQEALVCWVQLSHDWPKDVRHWMGRAWCCSLLGEHGEAQFCLNKAARLKPDDNELLMETAAVLDRAGKTDDALFFVRTVAANEDYMKPFLEKGEQPFGYLLTDQSSPDFIQALQEAFPSKTAQ